MSNSLVEVVLPESDYQDLLRSLEDYKERLQHSRDSLKGRKAQLIEYKDSESSLRIVERYVQGEEESIKTYLQKIRNIKAKIKAYKRTTNLVRLRDIKGELKHHTNITNISLKQRDGGEIFIEYVYHNIKCTPNSSPYLNLIDSSFDLLPVKAKIFLTCNKVFLLPLYEDGDKTTKGYDRNYAVHPHVLNSKGYPCLGDFNSSFFDAMSDFDLDTAVTILELFLEQADTRDDAGRFWPRFMLHNNGLKNYSQPESHYISDHDLNTDYRFYGCYKIRDGRRWYTIPIVEGGRITMLEGREADVLKFFKNYINI